MLARACVCAVILVGALTGPVLAQRVARVHLEVQAPAGRPPSLDETLLRRLIELRPGALYSSERADNDLASLLGTGLFDPLPGRWGCQCEMTDAGAVVYYRVTANPLVASYSFPGANRVPTADLRRAAETVFPIGSVYDITRTTRLAQALDRVYEEADFAASFDVRPCERGVVTVRIAEHYLDRVQVDWLGPEVCETERLVEALDLPRFAPIVPSSLKRAEERLQGSGLFEEARVAAGTPGPGGLVNVTVSLRPAALPAPPTAADRALLDPRGVIARLKWAAPLRLEVPLDLTPPVAAGALRRLAASNQPRDLAAAALAALDLGHNDEALAYARAASGASPPASQPLDWVARTRCAVIAGETPTLDGAPSSPRQVEAAKLAFATAEARLAILCEDLGRRPEAPASMRRLAGAAAAGSVPTGLPTEPYASAMQRATELLTGLENPADVRACLPEIEEILLSRELLREFDRTLRDAPDPIPPFHASAFGSSAVLAALMEWRASERASAEASYALGLYVLGRAFAETRLGRSVAAGVKCYEVGGPVSAAFLAERLFAEAARLPGAEALSDLATHQALAVLLTGPSAARDPEFARLLLDPTCHAAEALVHAAVAPDGYWGIASAEHRRTSAFELAENLASARDVGRGHLGVLALVWSEDLEGAQALAEQTLTGLGDRTPEESAALGLLALKRAAVGEGRELLSAAERWLGEAGAGTVFEPSALSGLLGCVRLAAGDVAGADRAFGIGG